MTTIRQHAEYATLINVFTVEPDRAEPSSPICWAAPPTK